MIPRTLFRDLYEIYASLIALVVSLPFAVLILVHHTITVLIGAVLVALKLVPEHRVHSYCDYVFTVVCKPLEWVEKLLKI